jgi:hypothetical protein
MNAIRKVTVTLVSGCHLSHLILPRAHHRPQSPVQYSTYMSKYLLFFLTLLFLASCATTPTETAASAVERYMRAKAASDADTIQQLLCSEMESQLEREVQTFAGVTIESIEGLSCQQVDDTNTVACTGEIVALYGTEQNRFPLTNYRVVQEDGEWKWCGESY